jgi:Xaa-Pro aminopeptidase
METELIQRTIELQSKIADNNMDGILLTHPDSIYYISNYCGYMGMTFGRPTLLFIPRSGECTIITPQMESEMCRNMTWIENVESWLDGVNSEWMKPLTGLLGKYKVHILGIEQISIPYLIFQFLTQHFSNITYTDATRLLRPMRMVKSATEIEIMRQAGEIAIAMVESARNVISEGIPEYEITLAAMAGGTRKAATFLSNYFFSPTIYNQQVLQSGHDTSMVHRRNSIRRLQQGEVIYLCFCGLANFKHYKLGFDREFFLGSVTDEQAKLYELAVKAQLTALNTIRPGVLAEEVHFAASEVYQKAGFEPSYRTGRSIGCSFLEPPELKAGDKTPLQIGMTFAVDGGITIPHQFGARVGDSIVVTNEGFEYLTPYPKNLSIL